MALFEIDQKKCIKCGKCSEVCPVMVVNFSKENGPSPSKWADEACIDCGHCVCVCPRDAFSHRSMSPEECKAVDENLESSKEQTEQLLASRRSIRVFKDKKVDKKTFKEIIRVAGNAPTGHNIQDVKWQVVLEKEEVDILKNAVLEWMAYLVEENSPLAEALNAKGLLLAAKRGYDVILREAPHLIVTYAHKDDRIAKSSCVIALTHLELAAKSYGLGTCWAGFLDLALSSWPPAQVVLDLPENHIPQGSMMIGYPKHKYHRIPVRKTPDITWM